MIPTNFPVHAPTPVVKPAKPRVKPPVSPKTAPLKPEPLWNVILINDNDHTYDYVIEMLTSIFIYPIEKCFEMAKEVDKKGRVIVATCHKELAELRQEQIMDFGPDVRVADCAGSMKADIEPAV
jgi:ATP-dependent Clp protease adaptor protein ClpS